MKVSIVVPDGRVTVDGFAVRLPLNLPGIHAVHMDTDMDRGEVEFSPIDPDGPGPLPAIKPENKLIGTEDFSELFGHVLPIFEREKALMLEALNRPPEPVPPKPPKPASVDAAEVARLKETVAGLEAELVHLRAKVHRVDAIIDAIGSNVAQIAEGEE